MRQSPSRTAEVVCLFRASERARDPEDRIVDDPFAPHFLTPAFKALLKGAEILGNKAWALSLGLRGFVLARHRYIDDALIAAARGPGFSRLLLLGAGYDSRAWRLADALGDATVYEVDHPATQARKAKIATRELPGRPGLVRVPVDFEREDLRTRLHEEGFADGASTFVVWEGVSMYLTRDAVKGTLSALAQLCGPGSRLSMDFLAFPDDHDWQGTFHRASPQLLSVLGEPVSFVIHHEDVGPFVERLGWRVIDLATTDALQARFGHGDTPRIYGPMYVVTLERASAR